MNVESSTIKTRNFLFGPGVMTLCNRHGLACRLRSHELFHCCDELVLLHGLGQKSRSAFLDSAVAVLGAGARGYDHHRNAACGGALAELSHQFIAGHARHFEVSNDEVATELGDKLGGVKTVCGEFHAV